MFDVIALEGVLPLALVAGHVRDIPIRSATHRLQLWPLRSDPPSIKDKLSPDSNKGKLWLMSDGDYALSISPILFSDHRREVTFVYRFCVSHHDLERWKNIHYLINCLHSHRVVDVKTKTFASR
jgi:hypothetical protein